MIPFVGGSYELRRKKADVQRSVNLFPANIESGSGKSPMYLASVPGLNVFSSAPVPGPVVIFTHACAYFAPAESGAYSILSWTVTGAVSVSISPSIGSVNAVSGTVNGSIATPYTLTATNATGGITTAMLTTGGFWQNYASYAGMTIFAEPTSDALAVDVANWYCTVQRGSTVRSWNYEPGANANSALVRTQCQDNAISSQILLRTVCA